MHESTTKRIQQHAAHVVARIREMGQVQIDKPGIEEELRAQLTAPLPLLDYNNDDRSKREMPGGYVEVTIRVPVKDPWKLLYSAPTDHPATRPTAQVDYDNGFGLGRDEVVFTYATAEAVTEEFKAWREEQYELVEGWIAGIGEHVDDWNTGVDDLLGQELQSRRAKLKSLAEFDLDA